jgi:hypothetical protein
MEMWLSKRLLAQHEAIHRTMLPYNQYHQYRLPPHQCTISGTWKLETCKEEIEERVKALCPNLIKMEEDDWLDKILVSSLDIPPPRL